MGSMWKTSLRIVGQACFALISFIVLLFLGGVIKKEVIFALI